RRYMRERHIPLARYVAQLVGALGDREKVAQALRGTNWIREHVISGARNKHRLKLQGKMMGDVPGLLQPWDRIAHTGKQGLGPFNLTKVCVLGRWSKSGRLVSRRLAGRGLVGRGLVRRGLVGRGLVGRRLGWGLARGWGLRSGRSLDRLRRL